MDALPYSQDEIRRYCQEHLRVRENKADYFAIFPSVRGFGRFGAKIAQDLEAPQLNYDLAFLQSLNAFAQPKYYKVPKAYGIVEDSSRRSRYLVMELLEGTLMSEIMAGNGGKLPESDANDIAAALRELRDNRALSQALAGSDKLTPLGHWHPQSDLFNYDRDGGRLITSQQDFQGYMRLRFKLALVDPQAVPFDDKVVTHGDPGPHNLIRCLDDKIGIVDWRTAFIAPTWWEYCALHYSAAGVGWTVPLQKAMVDHGMGVSDAIMQEVAKFVEWYGLKGKSYARAELKQMRQLKA